MSEEIGTEVAPAVESPIVGGINTLPVETPAEAAPWYGEGFDDDTVGYIQNKGWEGVGDIVESQRNLEKLMGGPRENLLKLPGADDPDRDAKIGDIYQKLGRPEKPDDYHFEFPEGSEQPNEAIMNWFKENAFSAGMSSEAATKFVSDFLAVSGQENQNQIDMIKAQDEQEVAELKREWLSKYEERSYLAEKAAETAGLTAEDLESIKSVVGPKKALKAFSQYGDLMGEDSIAEKGNMPGFGVTREQVINQKNELMREISADPKRLAAYNGGQNAGVGNNDIIKMKALQEKIGELSK
jgi:hypothetical protein